MMTLAQFYATHRLPNAIVIPVRVSRRLLKRADSGIALGPDTPAQNVEAATLLRRFRGDGSRGKKN